MRFDIPSMFLASWSRAALLVLLGSAVGLALPVRAQAQTAIYLETTVPDRVGRQLMFELREGLRRSAGLSLADRSQDARIHVRVVTLDPNEGASSGLMTVYSAVVTFRTFHDTPVDAYLTSYVGTCGSNRTSHCAQTLLAGIDEQASTMRAVLRNVLEQQRR